MLDTRNFCFFFGAPKGYENGNGIPDRGNKNQEKFRGICCEEF